MQLTSSVVQATSSVTTIPADSGATRSLIYRGTTYQIPLQRVSHTAQEQGGVAQLVSNRLMYRGATYDIVPVSLLEAIVPKTMRQLIYRGTTYLKAI